MIEDSLLPILDEQYRKYREILKPLIAHIEVREEKFPEPIFNEIRAFNDHVAQCYRVDLDIETKRKELSAAERHIFRIQHDLYKYLIVSFYLSVEKFNKEVKNIDLAMVSNGEFYPKFKVLQSQAQELAREARASESNNRNGSLDIFERAYNKYCELDSHIIHNMNDVRRLRYKQRAVIPVRALIWLFLAILSGVIGNYVYTFLFPCP